MESPVSVPQEDEHDPEDRRQRRALEFFTFLIVGEVDSALLRPSLHAHGKRWKRILTDRAVQSFVKLDAEGGGAKRDRNGNRSLPSKRVSSSSHSLAGVADRASNKRKRGP